MAASRGDRSGGQVVDLERVRAERRLRGYQGRISEVLDANRRSISRLHHSGALFSPEGGKAGRDLLLARQHLLKVVSLLDRLSDRAEVPAPRSPREIDAVYVQLDRLLERTTALTQRTGSYLARLSRD